jgi:tetratricopeptide (TPR) repeat protein
MRAMLIGLVPELPERALRSILTRADGIPLYAVEMVRMLAADGRLIEAEGVYRVVGDLGDVRVPDTLHSLIASRLDALDPQDRALLQDAAVLGQTFDVDALASVTGQSVDDLKARLRPMVRGELVRLDTDPRSPERGQYGFTQALIREVAYGTLSRRDRRAKHLAAARHYESLGDEEVAGVLATHYVDAWAAAPTGPDGEAVAGQARIALRAAAERAINLGSLEQAVKLLRRAREVTVDPAEDGELVERIGTALRDQGNYEEAIATLEEAVRSARDRGDRVAAVRAIALLGSAYSEAFRAPEAAVMLSAAAEEFEDLAPNPALTLLWAVAARATALTLEATPLVYADRALEAAERTGDVAIIADALVTKGSVYAHGGRWREGTALLEAAQRLATAHGLPLIASRAAINMAAALMETDLVRAVQVGREGLEIARRYGIRGVMVVSLANTIEASLSLGDWGWIDDTVGSLRLDDLSREDRVGLVLGLIEIKAIRGQDVSDLAAELEAFLASTAERQARSAIDISLAIVAAAQGRFEESHERALRAADTAPLNEPGGVSLAISASIRTRNADEARRELDRLEGIGARGPVLAADITRYRAALAALERRQTDATVLFQEAWRLMREQRLLFALAVCQLEYLAVTPPDNPAAAAIAAEARAGLTGMGALAYVRQLDEILAERARAPGKASEQRDADAAEATIR